MGSRFLIVLCSPDSKESHWVNEEIKLFRKLHGEGSILCALIEGTPETSFPPALLEGGREPLAANLNTKNFRLGVSQLAASILGVGLDALIQRDVKQRRNRMRLMMAGSFLFAGIMGVMAWNAIDARDEAETSRAEAEKMVEYMLTDLKDDLEPIGKLDILEKVGERVGTYYQAIPMSDMDDDRLARRARSQQLLGHVAIAQGNTDKVLGELHQVHDLTEKILRRKPNDPNVILTHAKSQNALRRAYQNDDIQAALEYGLSYRALSEILYGIDNDNLDYLYEYAWASNKLGQIYQILQDYDLAEEQFLNAASSYEKALTKFSDNRDIQLQLITFKRNLAIIDYYRGDFSKAAVDFDMLVKKTKQLVLNDIDNYDYLDSLHLTKLWQQHVLIMKLKQCTPNDIMTFTSELRARIDRDPTMPFWNSRYIKFVHDALKDCPDIFGQSWTHKTISNVNDVYRLIARKDVETQEHKIWLDNYQAK